MKKSLAVLLAFCLLCSLACAEEYLPADTKLDCNAFCEQLSGMGLPVPATLEEALTAYGLHNYALLTNGAVLYFAKSDYDDDFYYWQVRFDNQDLEVCFAVDTGSMDFVEYSYETDDYNYMLYFDCVDSSFTGMGIFDNNASAWVSDRAAADLSVTYSYPAWLTESHPGAVVNFTIAYEVE